MCWWLLGRIGVERLRDRLWLVVLFGFSTQILWITTRGGVWHTGQLIATLLTFGCLIELWGARRAWVVGLLAGAAFLTRAPVAFAMPFFALLLWPEAGRVPATVRSLLRAIPWRRWAVLTAAFLPAIVFFFAYNAIRFGSPLESGYALATLPDWLEALRAQGLFSIAHIPMNLDLSVRPSAQHRRRSAVLQAGRSGNVRVHHEPGAACSRCGPTGAIGGPGGWPARRWPS